MLENIDFILGAEFLTNDDRNEVWRRVTSIAEGSPLTVQRFPNCTAALLPLLQSSFDKLKLLKASDHPNILLPCLLQEENGTVLVIYPGEIECCLSDQIQRQDFIGSNGIEKFLAIAVKLAEGLKAFHDSDLILHGMNSSAVVFLKGEADQPRLCQMSLLTLQTDLNTPLLTQHFPNQLNPALEYLPPEETGRSMQALTFSSDLYSLGVVLYEMLYGRCPFEGNDQQSLLSALLSQPICFPKMPAAPEMLKRIIERLLMKDLDSRYLTVHGLLIDLRTFQENFSSGQAEAFELGLQDYTSCFTLASDFYGREKELAAITQYLVETDSSSNAVWVIGESGIGKTALVADALKTRPHNCCLMKTKLEQQISSPQQYIRNFFADIFHQSSHSDKLIQQLREKLGNSLATISWLFPIEMTSSTIADSSPGSSPMSEGHRFDELFLIAIKIIAGSFDFLVVWVDDLQWADEQTRHILELIMNCKLPRLTFIGSFRPEIADHDWFEKFKTRINANYKTPKVIRLRGLPLKEVARLIIKTLHVDPQNAKKLAECIIGKTSGHPLATREFLAMLHGNNLLKFLDGYWCFDLDEVEKCPVTENVMQAVLKRIDELPAETRSVLITLATLGSSIQHELLLSAFGNDFTAQDLRQHLLSSVNARVIRQEDETWVFSHDKILEAVCSWTTGNKLSRLHLEIARRLAASKTATTATRIAYHYMQAQSVITDDAEKSTAIQFLLDASVEHKAVLGYRESAACLLTALVLDPSLNSNYNFSYKLADTYMRLNQPNDSERVVNAALILTEDVIEQVRLLKMLVQQKAVLGQYDPALEEGRKALAILKMPLPESNQLYLEISKVAELLGQREFSALNSQLPMTELHLFAAMEVLSNMIAPALGSDSDPNLLGIITMHMLQLTLIHGPCAESASAYAFYAVTLTAFMQQPKTAVDFCQLGINIAERFKHSGQACVASEVFISVVGPWCQHIEAMKPRYQQVYEFSQASANTEYGGYGRTAEMCNRMIQFGPRDSVSELLAFYKEASEYLIRTNNNKALDTLDGLKFALLYIVEFSLKGTSEAEAYEADCIENKSYIGLVHFYIMMARSHCIMGEFSDALKSIEKAYPFKQYIPGFIIQSSLVVVEAIALAKTSNSENIKTNLPKINQLLQQIETWTSACPENFSHQTYLIQAELMRLDSKLHWRLIAEQYQIAIETALDNNFLADAAIASELRARFLQSIKSHPKVQTIVIAGLSQARDLFQTLGASIKITSLAKELPAARRSSSCSSRMPSPITSPFPHDFFSLEQMIFPSPSIADQLDTNALTQAILDLVEKKCLSDFLPAMLEKLTEYSGASSGYLLLVDPKTNVLCLKLRCRQGRLPAEQLEEPVSLEGWKEISGAQQIVHYVYKNNENLCLGQAAKDERLGENTLRSVLCQRLLDSHGDLSGILLIENSNTSRVFNSKQEILRLMITLCSIFLERLAFVSGQKMYTAKTNHHLGNPANVILGQAESSTAAINKLLSLLGKVNPQSFTVMKSKIDRLTNEISAAQKDIAHAVRYQAEVLGLQAAALDSNSSREMQVALAALPEFESRVPDTEPAAMAEPKEAIKNKVLTGENILVVDDVQMNRDILAMLLVTQGYRVETAENGLLAFERYKSAQATDHPFDLVLMDVQMPVMDGLESAKAIRAWEEKQTKTRTPIIAVTANVAENDTRKILAAGMDDHVHKPFNRDVIIKAMEKSLCRVPPSQRTDEAFGESTCAEAGDNGVVNRSLGVFAERSHSATIGASTRQGSPVSVFSAVTEAGVQVSSDYSAHKGPSSRYGFSQ